MNPDVLEFRADWEHGATRSHVTQLQIKKTAAAAAETESERFRLLFSVSVDSAATDPKEKHSKLNGTR